MGPSQHLADLFARHGLMWRGAFHPEPGEAVPCDIDGFPAATLVLLGFRGRSGWPVFATSPECRDGLAHPLDQWSRRIVSLLASELGARPLFPFDGPPWHPFGRWAWRAEGLSASPLGLVVHPTSGLWHSYRGALAFAERLDIEAPAPAPNPCFNCAAKPCLSACPVGAHSTLGFAATTCRTHLQGPPGAACMTGGCLARRACPIAQDQTYGTEQTAFLMRAFADA